MKPLLSLLAIATLVAISSTAQPSFAVQASTSVGDTCEQDCLDDWRANIRKNKKAAWSCSFSTFGICWAGSYSLAVLDALNDAADEIHEQCLDDCKTP